MPEGIKPANQAEPTPRSSGDSPANGALDSFLDDLKVDPHHPENDTPADDTPADDTPADDTPADDPVIPFDILEDAKPEDTKPEDTPDDYEPPETNDDPKAKHAWAELKRKNKQLNTKLAQLEDDKVAGATAEKIVELEKSNENLENQLGQYDLAATSSFQERYVAPLRGLAGRAVKLLTQSGVDEKEAPLTVQRVLQASNQADIDEILEDQPPSVQAALVMMASEYHGRDADRAKALADWKDSKAALDAQQARDQEVELVKMAEQDMAAALEQSLDEGNWMFRRTGGDNAEWDSNVEAMESQVRGLVKNAKPSEIIKWMIEGVTAKPLRELFAKESQRSKRLQSELAAALKGTPKLGGEDSKGEKPKGALDDKGPKTPDQVIDALF